MKHIDNVALMLLSALLLGFLLVLIRVNNLSNDITNVESRLENIRINQAVSTYKDDYLFYKEVPIIPEKEK